MRVMLFFILFSVHFFLSLFFFYTYGSRRGGKEGTQQDRHGQRQQQIFAVGVSNLWEFTIFLSCGKSTAILLHQVGRDRGASGREEEVEGQAGGLHKEKGGQMRGGGSSRGLLWAVSQSGGLRQAGDDREEEDERTEAGQHCCCPASSLAFRYVKHNKSISSDKIRFQ